MAEEIIFNGAKHVSAHDAAVHSGLTRDYIAKLCRDKKIRGTRVGKNWFVEEASFKAFLVQQAHAKSLRQEALKKERAEKYKTQRILVPESKKAVDLSPQKKQFILPAV